DDVRNLGAGNNYTVTEETPPSGWFKDTSSVTIGVHSPSTCESRLNGDGTIKDQTVASTTLAANSLANATNVKVGDVTGMAAGQILSVGPPGLESRVISSVGTSGSGGTGVTLASGLTNAHTSGDPVSAALPVATFTNVKGSILIKKVAKDKTCTAA